MNRYVIEYELSSGTKGIMIFSAVNSVEAEQYVRDLLQKYNYKAVSPLHQINIIDDLYRLYPPLQQEKEGRAITPILVLDQHKLARVVSDINPCHL